MSRNLSSNLQFKTNITGYTSLAFKMLIDKNSVNMPLPNVKLLTEATYQNLLQEYYDKYNECDLNFFDKINLSKANPEVAMIFNIVVSDIYNISSKINYKWLISQNELKRKEYYNSAYNNLKRVHKKKGFHTSEVEKKIQIRCLEITASIIYSLFFVKINKRKLERYDSIGLFSSLTSDEKALIEKFKYSKTKSKKTLMAIRYVIFKCKHLKNI